MESEKLALACGVCGCRPDGAAKAVWDGFAMHVYGDMIEWLGPAEETSVPEEECWLRSERMPLQGERWIVKAKYPFCFGIGERFRVLFMPAMSYLNGWEECPKEIEESAIVDCRLEGVLEREEYGAWIRVLIMEATPLPEISGRYPAVRSDRYLEELKMLGEKCGTYQVYEYERWVLHSWSAQGDFGQWALVHKRDSGSRHLVLLGDWHMHTDDVYCGNFLIS